MTDKKSACLSGNRKYGNFKSEIQRISLEELLNATIKVIKEENDSDNDVVLQCQSTKAQIGTLKSNHSLYTSLGTIKYIVA